MNTNKKKLYLATSLMGGLCALSILGNVLTFTEGSQASGRIPASMQGVLRQTLKFEQELARSLAAKIPGRTTASIGRQPDLSEQIRFEILQGKYALQIEGGKIARAEFVDAPATHGYPALIEDRVAFLTRFGKAFTQDEVGEVTLSSLQVAGSKTIETYKLNSTTNGQDVEAQFILDEQNRVLEMSVGPRVSAQ